jgi:hypothetical protein
MANILVTHVQQTSGNWCWAACSEMFLRRYGRNNLSQAALANIHNAKFGHGLDSMANDAEVNWILKNHGELSTERAGPLEWGALQAVLTIAAWSSLRRSITLGLSSVASMIQCTDRLSGYMIRPETVGRIKPSFRSSKMHGGLP